MLSFLIPKHPRVALPASRLCNSLKTIGQILVLWTVALAVVPVAIVSVERVMATPSFRPLPELGILLLVIASLLGLVTANVLVRDGHGTPLPLDTTRELVISGAYRHVRNPMALGGVAQAVGVGLWLGSPGVLAYAALGAALWQCMARPWEEADMEVRFGKRYRRYREEVACWVPRFFPYVELATARGYKLETDESDSVEPKEGPRDQR